MSISIIAAVADGLAIGRGGDLAFHISADLRRFKSLTMGHPIVMGRKTFESLPGGALPGRRNIVVTRSDSWRAPNTETAPSLEEALKLAGADSDEVFVIGGGQIYQQAVPLADTLLITRVFAPDAAADTFFPPYEDAWQIVESQPEQTDPRTGVRYQFQTLKKRSCAF